jgi:hypothetical protein
MKETLRHMKGQQIAMTMYLPPRKYWLLKALSRKAGSSMQQLLREALDEVLLRQHRSQFRDRDPR